ncbi:SRPBCC family protein [Streptomyces sp. MS06]|uniref:SRPBCC family protein n=1 Tax=Streptomyces sp. MS06 TaxID=3385974 RepID=UPI0039A0650E
MVTFLLERTAPLPPDEVWRRLTSWERHGDVIPLTRVTVCTPPPTGRGTVFLARSGLGPVGFDDRMEVTEWQPPGEGEPGQVRVEKRGRVVLGRVRIETAPGPGGGTRVVWRQELSVRFLPRLADPLLGAVARAMYGRAVSRLISRP